MQKTYQNKQDENKQYFLGWATPQLTASALEPECIGCILSCLVRNKPSVPPPSPCWLFGLQSWSVGCITDSILDRKPRKPERENQDRITLDIPNNKQTKGEKLFIEAGSPTLAKATLSDLKRMLSSVKAGASFRDWTITEIGQRFIPEKQKTVHQFKMNVHVLTKLLYNTGHCSYRLQLYIFRQRQI